VDDDVDALRPLLDLVREAPPSPDVDLLHRATGVADHLEIRLQGRRHGPLLEARVENGHELVVTQDWSTSCGLGGHGPSVAGGLASVPRRARNRPIVAHGPVGRPRGAWGPFPWVGPGEERPHRRAWTPAPRGASEHGLRTIMPYVHSVRVERRAANARITHATTPATQAAATSASALWGRSPVPPPADAGTGSGAASVDPAPGPAEPPGPVAAGDGPPVAGVSSGSAPWSPSGSPPGEPADGAVEGACPAGPVRTVAVAVAVSPSAHSISMLAASVPAWSRTSTSAPAGSSAAGSPSRLNVPAVPSRLTSRTVAPAGIVVSRGSGTTTVCGPTNSEAHPPVKTTVADGWAQAVDAHSTGAPISTTAAANRGPQDRLTLICHPPGRTNVLPERGRVPVPPWVNETRRGQ